MLVLRWRNPGIGHPRIPIACSILTRKFSHPEPKGHGPGLGSRAPESPRALYPTIERRPRARALRLLNLIFLGDFVPLTPTRAQLS